MTAPRTLTAVSRKRAALAGGAALAGLLVLLAGLRAVRWASDPAAPILLPEAGAEWIVADEPFRLACRKLRQYRTIFQTRFEVKSEPRAPVLTVKAFKVAAVFIDGQLAAEPRTDLEQWKEPVELSLDGRVGPGPHELQIHVANENAPPALLARWGEVGLATGRGAWDASADGRPWAPARLASATRAPEISGRFPSSFEALGATWPLIAPVFIASAALTLWRSRAARRPPWIEALAPSPSGVRWLLLFAWAILGANNVLKIPEYVGFDAPQHLEYIRHVAERGRIPLASEGWQMFQSPLYYLVSAPLYLLLSAAFEPATAAKLLRLVPLAAGAGQVQLCYLALRRVFPARPDLQVPGLVIGGLLPMNLYLAQGLGNEPLAALLCGAALVATLSLLRQGEAGIPPSRLPLRAPLLLGLLLGLALLTKVTAALLLAVLVPAAAWRLRGGRRPLLRAAGAAAEIIGTASLVSSWYYARNWIALGKPFFGGWDPGREIVWWQDPGYRTLGDLTRFGEALVRPVYAATAGFWDALYSTFWTDGYLSMVISFEGRPPWNYGLMISGALLALVPSAAMLLGAASLLSRAGRERWAPVALSSASIAVFLAALFCLFAALPIYSTGKATYLSGLTVAFAVLSGAGLDLAARRPLLRAFANGGLAAWAAAAYGAYFVF